jgi:hypothetical protein
VQGDVDPLQWLPRAIAPGAQRTNWDAVCERKQAAGEVMTWPVAREAFKQMVGESEDRAADAALTALMDGSVYVTGRASWGWEKEVVAPLPLDLPMVGSPREQDVQIV